MFMCRPLCDSPETTEETAEQKWPKESKDAGYQTKNTVHQQRRYQSFLPSVHISQASPKVRS
jgi:hypothetical protein